MKDHTVTDGKFNKLQNKFRGLVSEFNSRKFEKGIVTPPYPKFRLGLRDLLLDARSTLQPPQFDNFLEWIDFQIKERLVDIANQSIGFYELAGIYIRAPIVSLERELLWITARIKTDAEKLNAFRSGAEEIEYSVFNGDAEIAIDNLKIIEEAFGSTLWSVQLRIALENLAGGLERQKKYTAEVRSVYKRGLLGFIAYHTSVRNEDRSTFTKYCEDIKARIERHQYYDQSIKTYARYRLAGEWPMNETGLAEILRVEQSHSLIEVYETFVAVAQEIARREDLIDARDVLIKCLQRLVTIEDFRLAKVLQVLDGNYDLEAFKSRSVKISDPLFTGDVQLATRIARIELKSPTEIDCWQYIYSGIAYSHATRPRLGAFKTPSDIPWLIGKVIRRCDCESDTIAQLEKVVINLRGLPAAAGIIDLIPLLRRPQPDANWQPWFISMNSKTIGVEDFSPRTHRTFIRLTIDKKRAIGPTEASWGRFHGHEYGNTEISEVAVTLFSAAGMLREGQFEQAIEVLTPYHREDEPEPIRSMTATMLLHAYFCLGHRQSVIELIADEGSRGTSNMQLLPVMSALNNYAWDDFKAVSSPLAAPIALHALWTLDEQSTTASHLRFATSLAIRASGVRLPSMMANLYHQYAKHQLFYFLKKVCVPEIIDHSRVLKNSREVMEERMAICTALREIDKPNAGAHQDEVMAISNQLALDEGQWIVDRTRIHVDPEALLRWAVKDFSEDFSRYRDLLNLDIGEKQNFDDVLKELIGASTSYRRSAFTPENEADAVLVSMLNRCRDEFLYNPNFGFDFHLSKRVRHQSFIGLIRGPLEFAQLITTRESEYGGYHRNEFWINKFTTLSAAEKENLNNALVKFSTKFDETLMNAKDKRFHLRSHEHPAGLFYVEFAPEFITLVRTLLRTDVFLPDFINTIIGALWGAIEPSLAEGRRFVSEDLKTKISQGFDELRAAVKKIAAREPALIELDMEIGQKSTDVQRALDEVSTWFTHSDTDAMKRYFTVDQVFDIAVDAALKCRRPFTPEITRNVETDIEMLSATSLAFVHDVLFTAFDNARAHSGHHSPKIEINANVSKEKGAFTVEVITEASSDNRSMQEEELKEIRQLIDNRNFARRTRNEGKSGILKLAAVVYQSSKGDICFGFTENGQFQLKVTYSLIHEETSNYGAAYE